MAYQSFPNKLKKIEAMGFKIPWKLINMGLYGYDEIPSLLTYDDILEYLDSILTNSSAHINDIIALICEKDNFVQFDKLLKEYSANDESNPTLQKRKWKVYLLNNVLENISQDYLQGILELMEFWVSMGISKNCPQSFPSGNKEEVKDYFSQSSYFDLIQRNKIWLDDEIKAIRKLET